jgi:two-component system nitrogen regulation sensor histidine kinase NtrY
VPDAGAPRERERERARDMIAQLDTLAPGESRLLTDLDGRRYRAQRGQFYDRGFARHFLMVEELTAELEDSERATYAKLVRVLAHEVNNTVAATCSVLDSLLFYREQLAAADAGDFSTAVDAVKRRNVSLGEFIDRFTRVVKMPEPELRPASLRAIVDDILWLNREACAARGIELRWLRCDEVGLTQMDAQLIEQALLNVVKNAIEAVQARQALGVAGGHVHRHARYARKRGRAVGARFGRPARRSRAAPAVHALLHHQARRPGHRPDVRARGAEPAWVRVRARRNR